MKYQTKLPLFALLMSIIAFVSCQKDVVINNEAEQFTAAETDKLVYMAAFESYQVPADKAKAKISQVAEALRTSDLQLRSDNTVPIAEAVWDIEALSNASQAQVNWHYKKMSVAKTYIPLTTTSVNGQLNVSMQEVVARYATAVAAIQQAGVNTGYPSSNRQTIYADVVPFQDENGDVVLELNTGVGLDPEGCPTCPTLPTDPSALPGCETTDTWKTTFRGGLCNSTAMQGLDASDAIQSMVRYSAATVGESECNTIMGQVTPPSNGNGPGIFINIVRSPDFRPEDVPNPNFQTGMPEYTRFLLLKTNPSLGGLTCLDPLQLYFFKNNVEKLIVDSHNANSNGLWTNRYFVNCDVSTQIIVNGAGNIRHFLNFNVGTFVP
jgi:hypothetical protein